MLASLALFAMLALPLMAGIAARALSRLTGNAINRGGLVAATGLGFALLTLLGAWVWRLTGSGMAGQDAVIAGWSSASFVGAPLALAASAAGAMAVIAIAAVRAAAMMDVAFATASPAISSGLFALGAGMAFLGSTVPTLLIGIGLMDVASVWIVARRSNGRDAVRAFVPQSIGVMLAGLAFTLAGANANSFFITSIQAPETAQLATVLSIAACAHANVLPFGAARDAQSGEQLTASTLGALALLQHGPALETWAMTLVLLTAAFWAVRSVVPARPVEGVVYDANAQHGSSPDSLARVRQAAGAFALIASASGNAHLAAAAWILGSALLESPALTRVIGAASLAGLPLLAGFPAYSGAAAALIERGGLSAAAVLLLLGSHALLVFALLRWACGTRTLRELSAAMRLSIDERTRLLPAVLLGLHLLALGLFAGLSGGASVLAPFGAMGVAGWLTLLIALALGFALWRVSSSGFGANQLERIDLVLERSGAWGSPVLASLERIRGGFRFLLAVLESDGALLWACLSVLIALLIARPGTP